MTMTMTMTANTKMTSEEIGTLALEAMLLEVSVTPKPGLVDRNNSGAHRDMGFFTFMKSAAGLRSSFEDFAEAGIVGGVKKFLPREIFPYIRKIGIEAEKRMFSATGGVNTHKGEIFSLGLLSACSGYLSGSGREVKAGDVMKTAAEMCRGICERDFAEVKTKSPESLTKGERVYIEHGITGIRGEAEDGYPAVRNISLPALKKYLDDGFNMNDAMAMTLIHIMAHAQDTNIISRHDILTAQEVMINAKKMISSGFGLDDIKRLDDDFISKWISPGGSGDLLAVTYFLYALS